MKSEPWLAKGNCGTFVTFGEMQHCLWTVKEYEEVAVWRKCWHWCCPSSPLDMPVNVIGLYGRRFKHLRFQCFGLVSILFDCLFVCFIVHSKTTALNMGHVVSFTLKTIRKWGLNTPPPSSCLPDPSKENELCSLCYYSGRTTFIKNLQENVTS